MRIVVSGTHASGKSTLVSDFALRHPQYTVLPDPFDLVDEDAPLGAALFARQLRIAADRLTDEPDIADLIAERGPLDFLAYLLALADLKGEELDEALHERARARVVEALATVDLLIVLPLGADAIDVGADEHLDLRDRMDEVLLDLLDDAELVPAAVRVHEITGGPAARAAALEALARGD